MDSAIICIHLRNCQPPISLKITPASLIRNTLTKNYEFSQFFLCSQTYRFRDISETSELKSTTENCSASTRFIHFDGLCNYLHSFETQPAANFFKNNSCFPDQDHVGHYINKFTETGQKITDYFIKCLLRAI